MRRQPVGHAAFTERIDARERGQEPRHTGRIPPGTGSVLNAQSVGFEFSGAIVLQEQHAEDR